jgi:PIN domain nuclease of toxin-antitoxin system
LEFLLDTQVFLWWDSANPLLNSQARRAIADPANQIFVSAASVWEIAIKRRTGKLAFAGSPGAAIGKNGFFELAILPMDAELAGDLGWNHADPFDRLLVAQAGRLRATLVTADAVIRAFDPVVTLWAG